MLKQKIENRFQEIVNPENKKIEEIERFRKNMQKEGKMKKLESLIEHCDPLDKDQDDLKKHLLTREHLESQVLPPNPEPMGNSLPLDETNEFPLFDRVFLLGSLQPQMPKFNDSWPLNFQTLFGFDSEKKEFTQNPLLNLQNVECQQDQDLRLSATPLQLWEDFETEKNNFLQFLIPFEINARSTRMKPQLTEVQSKLFRDDSAASSTEFFFIAINPQHQQNENPNWNEMEVRSLEASQLYESAQPSDFHSKTRKQVFLLSQANPNKFSFYFVVKQEELFFAPSPVTDQGKSLEMFSVPRFLILSSRYPLTLFFQEVLLKMTSFLRQSQLESFTSSTSTVSRGSRRPSVQSLSMFTSALRSRETMVKIFGDLTRMCSSLLRHNPFVLFDRPLSLQMRHLSVHHTLPDPKCLYLLEVGSSFSHILSNLRFEDFIVIFMSHLFEKKVVFISENNHSLCSAIATFNALLRPFRWTYPVIYNLPETCLPILQSPIPVQIGLKVSAKRFLSEIGPGLFPDMKTQTGAIFVFLDESLVMTNSAQLNSLFLPFFDDFLVILRVLYKKHFNAKSSKFIKISKKKSKDQLGKYSFSRTSKYSYKEKLSKLKKKDISEKEQKKRQERLRKENLQYQQQSHREVFTYFWSLFQSFIVNKLPSLKNLSQTLSCDSDGCFGELRPERFSSNPFDQLFLKRFFATQMFKFYFEDEFLKRKN